MAGLLDDLVGGPAPSKEPQAGLLDDLLEPQETKPAGGGLLDDLVSPAVARGSAQLTSRPRLQEGRQYDARGLQFRVQDGQLVEQTPQRREFFQERPEMLQDKKPQYQLPQLPGLAQLPKGRQVTGQEAARAEGLTGGYRMNEATYNPTDPDFLSRASQRMITPFLQAARDAARGEGLKDINAPNLLNPDDLRELGAPQGEGQYATFQEFAGLQQRAPYAQGNVMEAPRDAGEAARRGIAVTTAEMLNPADPLNILMEVGLGGAPVIAKVGRGIGDVLSVGDDAAEAFARGLSEGAQDTARGAPLPTPESIGYLPEAPRAVPQDIASGPIEDLMRAAGNTRAGQAVGQFTRRLGQEAGIVRQAIEPEAAATEARVGGINIVEPPPPPRVPVPRGDLPELAPGADLAVPQRFDPLAILPEGLPQREMTVPSASVDQIDEMLRPRQAEFRPLEQMAQDPMPDAPPEVAPPEAPAQASVFSRDKAPNNVPFTIDRNGRQVRQWLKLTAKEKRSWAKMTPEQRVEMLSGRLEQRGGSFVDLPQKQAPTPEVPGFTAERPMALPQQGELLTPPPLNPERPLSVPRLEFREPPGLLDDLLPAGPRSPDAQVAAPPSVPDAPTPGLLDELLPVADEVVPAPGKSGGVRLSAFGAAELQELASKIDKIPGQIYRGFTKLSDQAISLAERTAAGRATLRTWRHWMRAGGNAPPELIRMGEAMQDQLSAVSAQIADEIVPMLRGDMRQNFLVRLAPGGKWSVLEQQAVGDLIKGETPRAPLPKGGEEAGLMAKNLLLQDGLDLLSQTMAVDRAILGELKQDEILELGKLIRGQKPLAESVEKLQDLALKSIRDLERMGALTPADANGVRAIKDNLLHERTFFRRAGRYMPRMYNKFEWDELAQKTIEDLVNLSPPEMSGELRQVLVDAMQPTAHANRGIQNRMKTIIRDRFLRRKDLPPELRQALGEILEPAFPVAKGHYQIRQSIEQQKMNRFIASNSEWVRPEGEIGFYDYATKRPYVKMAEDTPEFGVLSGRLVHPDVADFLEMQRLQSSAGEKFWDQAVAAWKFNKVVLNPASHARNLMSNVVMADLAGMGNNPWTWKQHLAAAQDYLTQGVWYKEARDIGVLGGTFHENEIRALADGLLGPAAAEKQSGSWFGRIGEYLKAGGRGAGEMVNAEDQLFKLSVYKHMRNQGMSPLDAKQYVKDWMPNYQQNGRLVQIAAGKNTGSKLDILGKVFANPFVNFTASALPKAAKAALGIGLRKGEMRALDPMVAIRFWKYPIAAAGITAVSAKILGMTSREVEESQPDYMRTVLPGAYPMLPWRDRNGRLQFVDLSYILPWGDALKVRSNPDDPTPPPILSTGGPAAPLLEAIAFNKSLFTGKEIYGPGMTDEQKAARIIDHIYRGWMPALAPGIPGLTGSEASIDAASNPQEWEYALSRSGGSSSSKIASSLFQIPDYKGRQRAMATTLADVFLGIKVQPVDPAATARSKAFNRVQVIRGINEEVKRVRKDQGWAAVPEVRERYIQRLQEQKATILRGGQVQQNYLLQDFWDSVFQPEPGINPVEPDPTAPIS